MPLLLQVQFSLWTIIIIQSALLFFVILHIKRQRGYNSGISLGRRIPDVFFSTVEGKKIHSHDLLNKNDHSLLCAISPNCPTCEEIIHYLEEIQDADLKKVKLITYGDKSKLEEWIKKVKPIIPIYILEEEDLNKKMNINMFPFGMLVNKEGEVVKKHILSKEKIVIFLNEKASYA